MKQKWMLLKILLLGLLAIILIFSFMKRSQQSSQSQNLSSVSAPSLPVYGTVPDVVLTERSGKPMNLADLRGKVWIADFIFTHCAGPCPLMSGYMRTIQERVQSHPDIQLVSFSVDPDRDTPEVLSEYAKKYDASPTQWLFLTGDKQQIFKLTQESFHLGVADVVPEERQNENQVVSHSTKFVLVDKQGQIRGYYDSENPSSIQQLINDAVLLTTEKV